MATPWRTAAALAALAAAGALLPGGASAQQTALVAEGLRVDSTGLGSGRHARMEMLLEKTLFKVDVLRLSVVLDREAAERIESALAAATSGGWELDDEALEDTIAAIALDSREALTEIEFERDVGLEQFLDGIRSNLEKAREADLITASEFEDIAAQLPRWYDFLAERGIDSGDRMVQRIRGDTLRTIYVTAAGDVLLDQQDVGPVRRLSVLGGYFAPGSDFREDLVRSIVRED